MLHGTLGVALSLCVIGGIVPSAAQAQTSSTPVDFKIAFIGDQALGSNARAVLNLIKAEGTDAVMHQGDFDYEDNPQAWEAQINAVLGPNFPYFASVGNHDEGRFYGTGGYQELLEARLTRLGIPWQGDLGAQSTVKYGGIFMVLTGPGVFGDGDGDHELYIEEQLERDNSIWSVSSWHKNQHLMQAGGKGDEAGWGVYEASRRGGAIVATGHEHSYSRTHLLSSCRNQTVASTSNTLALAADDPMTTADEGRTFVFVSGLGGNGIRNQEVSGDWFASIYTTDQNAKHGALFGVFNYQGDPRLARFYFKDVDGFVVEEFFVRSTLGAAGGGTTTTTTTTTTPSPSTTVTTTTVPRPPPTSTTSSTTTTTTTTTTTMRPGGGSIPIIETYSDGTDSDQDDMAIWVHPTDPSRSTIIASDKGNGNVYVYALDGTVIQTVAAGQPGNIDIRYGFGLGQQCVDLVAFNDRDQGAILVYKVDPSTRQLTRVDDGSITTGENYGFTLYRHNDGRLFAHTGPKSSGLITQYELRHDGSGHIAGSPTGWSFDESTVEGMVADDETGDIYLAEESGAIWRVSAMDDLDKTQIAAQGDGSGLQADVEGITIYYAAGGKGYIIASSQGADKFTVLNRESPHAPAGEFTIPGVGSTDGIDVLNMNLGTAFPKGAFTAHNGANCCAVQAVRWDDIAAKVGGLLVDTGYWDPRDSNRSCGAVPTTTTTTLPRPTTTTTTTTTPSQPTTTTTTTTIPGDPLRPVAGCGDFDSDKRLTMSDALGIVNAALGLADCALSVCDVNNDGGVSVLDVLGILQVLVYNKTSMSCPTSLDPAAPTTGVWTSRAELASIPMSGAAWARLKAAADSSAGSPDVSNQDDPVNVQVMAKALVYARTGQASYRDQVINACMAAIGTEQGGRTLALGRELIAYVIAADLVGLPADKDAEFRAWLERTLTEELDGRTLVSTHEDRPNNWGTHAGASRAAVAAYLGDTDELERVARVLKGWLGDRSSYGGFSYGDLDWQADPGNPVGINPKGSTKDGHSIDGVLPDDLRRSGGFSWPPPTENYVYEALQGALAQAVILDRAGFDVWNWEDKALLRAFQWLHTQADFPAEGDDCWQPHVINHYYGTNFPAPVPGGSGKNVGWTDWTHGMRDSTEPPPPLPTTTTTTTTTTTVRVSTTTTTTTTVPGSNRPPSVAITSPASGATFDEGDTIVIAAAAADPGGSVLKVELLARTAELAEDMQAPYQFTLPDMASGSYALTAKATDNQGAVATSAAVTINVRAPTPPEEPGVPTTGIWTSREELASIPMSGAAWTRLKSEADASAGSPDVSNQDDPVNVRIMAKALVYARTGQASYRDQVINACMAAIGTEQGGRTLALGRELIAYVIAADLVGLPADKDQTFRAWLQRTLTEVLDGKTLVSTHEDRPNNWGTHAGASRAAVAAYLGNTQELERVARVFKGWLGDRSSYAGFSYGELGWQVDPANPVGINPKGATKSGHSIDGVLPDDQRRAGGFSWPPPAENYVYEALQGALAQAVILDRAGYDVWNWEDKALLRAFQWLHTQAGFPAGGDDSWQPHVINHYYGTNFPAPVPGGSGKNVGWTDWTHGARP